MIARPASAGSPLLASSNQSNGVFVDGLIPVAIYALLALALVISIVGRVRSKARKDT